MRDVCLSMQQLGEVLRGGETHYYCITRTTRAYLPLPYLGTLPLKERG